MFCSDCQEIGLLQWLGYRRSSLQWPGTLLCVPESYIGFSLCLCCLVTFKLG